MDKWTFGLNLGVFTIEKEVDLADPDVKGVKRLFRRLADHSALYEELQVEYAGKVVKSIKRLRIYLGKLLDGLDEESVLEEALLTLQQICREFRDSVDEIQSSAPSADLNNEQCRVTQIEPEGYRWLFILAFQRLRVRVGDVIALISEKSGIPVPRRLQPMLPKKRAKKR